MICAQNNKLIIRESTTRARYWKVLPCICEKVEKYRRRDTKWLEGNFIGQNRIFAVRNRYGLLVQFPISLSTSILNHYFILFKAAGPSGS